MKELLIDCLSELDRTQIMLKHCRNRGIHEPFIIEQTVRNNLVKKRILEALEEPTVRNTKIV